MFVLAVVRIILRGVAVFTRIRMGIYTSASQTTLMRITMAMSMLTG
jgi:hypothetical protein